MANRAVDDHLFRMGNESDAHGSVVIAFLRIAKSIRALPLISEVLFRDFTVGLASVTIIMYK